MSEPALTLKQAATACSVSFSTIRRRHAAGAFPNAHQDRTGAWLIPVSDLLAAGLTLTRTRPVDDPQPAENHAHEPPGNNGELAHAQAEIQRLAGELVEERTARRVAEATATERLRHLEDLRVALRAISGPPGTETPPDRPEQPSPARTLPSAPREPAQDVPQVAQSARRRWWQRR